MKDLTPLQNQALKHLYTVGKVIFWMKARKCDDPNCGHRMFTFEALVIKNVASSSIGEAVCVKNIGSRGKRVLNFDRPIVFKAKEIEW